jgi:hypothetical protein
VKKAVLVAGLVLLAACGSDSALGGTDDPSSDCPGGAFASEALDRGPTGEGYATAEEAVEAYAEMRPSTFAAYVVEHLSSGWTGATGVSVGPTSADVYLEGRQAGQVSVVEAEQGGYLASGSWYCAEDFPLDAPPGGTVLSGG